jgi:hypothetical protein
MAQVKKRILIVDEEKDVGGTLETILEKLWIRYRLLYRSGCGFGKIQTKSI